MKKIVALLLSLVLLCAALPVLAEDEGRILALDAAYANLANMSAQVKGGESTDCGCLGLQSAKNADGTFADGYVMFAVEVETAGLYDVTVRYAAKAKEGQIRCADLVMNEGKRIALPIKGMADWDVYANATVTVYLAAGMNTLTVKNVEGFDNSMYKAINLDYLAWKLVSPAADQGSILALDAYYTNLNDMNAQFKGNESSEKGVLGLQPAKAADGTFLDGHIRFDVAVKTAGTYKLTVRYAAKAKDGQTRCADMIVNAGERIHLPIKGMADWDVYTNAVVEVELAAGLNTIVLTNVEGFDNSTWKAINVDFLAWEPTPVEAEVVD